MVFSSYAFVLGFLPLALLAIFLAKRFADARVAVAVASIASLYFYAYWDWRFLWVILVSIGVNYSTGRLIASQSSERVRKAWLAAGIGFNLALLGYFKYTNFLLDNVSALFDLQVHKYGIILPLGISFFTFQQIAYLSDVYRRQVDEHGPLHYVLFVSFFPQLIAGPIVHHREMMRQFVSQRFQRIDTAMFAQGVAIFTIGLCKKVLIADRVAGYATPVFDAAASGVPVPLLESWVGVLAYSFQIYFDFSAYSDMAVGAGLMTGIRLPINFLSPYKSTNIIEFWRRWHMTLSRFLRDYVYIPMGGGRRGPVRRHANLMAVMLLGGLWHGAGWTFVIWGGLHGLALMINHAWQRMRGSQQDHGLAARLWGVVLTFAFVSVAWTFFRAEDTESALNIFGGLFGANGIVLPATYEGYLGGLSSLLVAHGVRFEYGYLFLGVNQILILAGLLAICWFLPNSCEWVGYKPPFMARQRASGPWRYTMWRPTVLWALALSGVVVLCLVFMSSAGEFLYFQF